MYSSAEIEGRAFFRDLATNASGRVVLMGLTYEETAKAADAGFKALRDFSEH